MEVHGCHKLAGPARPHGLASVTAAVCRQTRDFYRSPLDQARPPDSQDIYSWHSASVTHRSGASGGVHGSAAGERLALGRVYLGIEQNGGLVVERWPGRRNHPATGGQHRKSRLGAGRGGRLDTCRGTVTHTADTTASRLSTALLQSSTAAFYLTVR